MNTVPQPATILVTIEGEVGIGKSILLIKILDMLRAEGANVTHNVCEQLERSTRDNHLHGKKVVLCEKVWPKMSPMY